MAPIRRGGIPGPRLLPRERESKWPLARDAGEFKRLRL